MRVIAQQRDSALTSVMHHHATALALASECTLLKLTVRMCEGSEPAATAADLIHVQAACALTAGAQLQSTCAIRSGVVTPWRIDWSCLGQLSTCRRWQWHPFKE